MSGRNIYRNISKHINKNIKAQQKNVFVRSQPPCYGKLTKPEEDFKLLLLPQSHHVKYAWKVSYETSVKSCVLIKKWYINDMHLWNWVCSHQSLIKNCSEKIDFTSYNIKRAALRLAMQMCASLIRESLVCTCNCTWFWYPFQMSPLYASCKANILPRPLCALLT